MDLKHDIAIVGVGPGDPDYVTPIGRKRIDASRVLLGAQRLLDMFPSFQGKKVPLAGGIEEALDAIARALPDRVAVLVSGDPGLMSLSSRLLSRFGRHRCEVIAGISSVQVAFARMGVDWQGVRIVDAHGRVPEIDPASLSPEPRIAVLSGCGQAADWLVALGHALDATHQLIALQDLSLVGEKVWTVRPAALAPLAAAARTIVLCLRKDLLA
jgi:precorrin-6y C5,15-methyltransferase (decarboxylating) CbiE subunit